MQADKVNTSSRIVLLVLFHLHYTIMPGIAQDHLPQIEKGSISVEQAPQCNDTTAVEDTPAAQSLRAYQNIHLVSIDYSLHIDLHIFADSINIFHQFSPAEKHKYEVRNCLRSVFQCLDDSFLKVTFQMAQLEQQLSLKSTLSKARQRINEIRAVYSSLKNLNEFASAENHIAAQEKCNDCNPTAILKEMQTSASIEQSIADLSRKMHHSDSVLNELLSIYIYEIASCSVIAETCERLAEPAGWKEQDRRLQFSGSFLSLTLKEIYFNLKGVDENFKKLQKVVKKRDIEDGVPKSQSIISPKANISVQQLEVLDDSGDSAFRTELCGKFTANTSISSLHRTLIIALIIIAGLAVFWTCLPRVYGTFVELRVRRPSAPEYEEADKLEKHDKEAGKSVGCIWISSIKNKPAMGIDEAVSHSIVVDSNRDEVSTSGDLHEPNKKCQQNQSSKSRITVRISKRQSPTINRLYSGKLLTIVALLAVKAIIEFFFTARWWLMSYRIGFLLEKISCVDNFHIIAISASLKSYLDILEVISICDIIMFLSCIFTLICGFKNWSFCLFLGFSAVASSMVINTFSIGAIAYVAAIGNLKDDLTDVLWLLFKNVDRFCTIFQEEMQCCGVRDPVTNTAEYCDASVQKCQMCTDLLKEELIGKGSALVLFFLQALFVGISIYMIIHLNRKTNVKQSAQPVAQHDELPSSEDTCLSLEQ